jgi:predicted ferric reductase
MAANSLVPSANNPAVAYGIASLLFMIVLLWLTFYVRPKYHIWKTTHKFLGLAFLLGGLHVFLIPSDVSLNFPLRIYMLVITLLGLLSVFYRTVFNAGKKWEYKVKNVRELEPQTLFEVELEPIGEKMAFESGQFIFISFISPEISREQHPFSLVGSPKDDNLKIIIKRLGDYTGRIKNIRQGVKAIIQGPFGKFNYRNFGKNQIWIAGGIGIAPFLGMARDFDEAGGYRAHLFYSVSKMDEAVYHDYFNSLTRNNRFFNYAMHDSSVKSFITAMKICEECGEIKNRDILICGPGPMMASLKKQFMQMGIPKSKIHTEEFMF